MGWLTPGVIVALLGLLREAVSYLKTRYLCEREGACRKGALKGLTEKLKQEKKG